MERQDLFNLTVGSYEDYKNIKDNLRILMKRRKSRAKPRYSYLKDL